MSESKQTERLYRVWRSDEVYEVTGFDRNDAIYNLHIKTGMPEDFIKKHFNIKRLYGGV